MSAEQIHPDLPDAIGDAFAWLRANHLPVPYTFEVSGSAPSMCRRVEFSRITWALIAGAEVLVTNDTLGAVKDFGPLRLCFTCPRWDCRTLPPVDRAEELRVSDGGAADIREESAPRPANGPSSGDGTAGTGKVGPVAGRSVTCETEEEK